MNIDARYNHGYGFFDKQSYLNGFPLGILLHPLTTGHNGFGHGMNLATMGDLSSGFNTGNRRVGRSYWWGGDTYLFTGFSGTTQYTVPNKKYRVPMWHIDSNFLTVKCQIAQVENNWYLIHLGP